MAAVKYTSPDQFREVHRGLHIGSDDPEELARVRKDPMSFIGRRIGNHWTHDPAVARHFSLGDNSLGEGIEYDPPSNPYGIVVHGRVHERHIVQPGTTEHQAWQNSAGVLEEDHAESESTVRDLQPVHVTGVTVTWGDDEGQHSGSQKHDVRKVMRT